MITNKTKRIQKKFSIGGLIGVHVSSIVNEVISAISNQFIFFLQKDFARTKTQIKPKPTNFLSLKTNQVFMREKLLPLLFYVCIILFVWLVLV